MDRKAAGNCSETGNCDTNLFRSGVLACRFGTISLYCAKYLCLIDFLLSRESDGCAKHRTHPDSVRSCICFRIFCSSVASEFFVLLLVRFDQADLTQNRVYLK